MKRIAVLGSTGSIGRQTLDVVSTHPERLKISALAARDNWKLLSDQIKQFNPKLVAVAAKDSAHALKKSFPRLKVTHGDAGLLEAATFPDVHTVLVAIVGTAALKPTVAAIRAGKNIALASKEVLVAAGTLIMQEMLIHGTEVLPVDSEHSAIFQCLQGEVPQRVERLILTASGGPFLNIPAAKFAKLTVADALNHPTWKMGQKISIDSATLMNKGLEVIEAHFLFGIPYEKIEVIVHPQSIIHSMVEFVDGSVMAQMNLPDMRIPIQYALTHPERLPSPWIKVDFNKIKQLTFAPPDMKKFPCLSLAYAAGKTGGTLPAVLSAANEKAVELFLKEKIKFTDIPKLIEKAMNNHKTVQHPTLEDIIEADLWARAEVVSR